MTEPLRNVQGALWWDGHGGLVGRTANENPRWAERVGGSPSLHPVSRTARALVAALFEDVPRG